MLKACTYVNLTSHESHKVQYVTYVPNTTGTGGNVFWEYNPCS